MTTNSSSTPAATAPAPQSTAPAATQPFQSASLYAGDLNPDVTEVTFLNFGRMRLLIATISLLGIFI
jgi:hypothetical protein